MKRLDVLLLLCTVPNRKVALQIANELVVQRLAACVNIMPGLTSVYRWKDEIQYDPEELLLIKTTSEALDRIKQAVKELHPYELPEIIALNVGEGLEEYLKWVVAETTN